jgi:hypothetical protein
MIELPSARTRVWSARALITAVAIALAWYSWGHWGDLQIDCGRELYVPVDILRGKLLFRDIWYQYGPLPPYIQALAFAIFGIYLNVLFALGLILVIFSALLLFEITRTLEMVLPAAMLPALFFLAESFRPTIFNFVFPYSYAASMGACFGLTCLFFTVRHALTSRVLWLGFASLCASLALLAKQELGIACLVVVGFDAVAYCLNGKSWRELLKISLACGAGLVPALLGYGFLIWKVSAKTIFIDNWVMMPGSYAMKTIGSHKIAAEGVRFGINEWSSGAVGVLISIALWFLIAYVNVLAISRLRLQRLLFVVFVVEVDIVLILFGFMLGGAVWAGLPALIGQMVLPKGLFLLGCAFMILAIWKVWRTSGEAYSIAEAALGMYAVLAGIRVMMEISHPNYAVFFNGPAFLVFTIVIARVIGRAGKRLDVRHRQWLVSCMLSAEAVLLVILFFPPRNLLNAPLKTEFGTIYTTADRAVLFPEIVSFMKTHTRSGRDILVLPESASLYFFSSMQSPTRWYEAQPGVLDPQQELAFIRQADSAHVRYVLLDHRSVKEFGIAPFGIGYDQAINKWLITNYIKVGQFGPRTDLLTATRFYDPYVMDIYERKTEK